MLLAYRLPREPSTPRIAVWRRLRRLGVAQLSDGLVAAPLDSRTREQLDWVADAIVEHGGEASLWVGQPGRSGTERALVARMKEAIDLEYAAIETAAKAASSDPRSRRRALARLRRELGRIALRDYFPGQASHRANAAVERLGRLLEAAS